MNKVKINPWAWIPTLYFAEGIPYFIVNTVSTIMFKRMGMSNADLALYTSLLSLPWVFKPFWSPFVDIIRTKRWWVVFMQLLMTAGLVALGLTLPSPSAETIASGATPVSMFVVTLVVFWIIAFASATHDIAADGFYMLALPQERQAFFVGIRSTFFRLSSIFGQGVLVVIAGLLERHYDGLGGIPKAWAMTIGICSLIFGTIALYHVFFMPRPEADAPRVGVASAGSVLRETCRTFVTFFRKPGIWLAILFMLLYRLPEAFLVKMINPFLLDGHEAGGLGLATETVGFIYGTIGIIGLTAGGIIGGIAASRWGLKKSLWPMALAITLPDLAYVYFSLVMPDSLLVINACVFVEQFGYGFGFTAYMLYMIYVAEGE
ncbi:MAG: MFS transporter, partial [Bacteroidales bacterium]|nr:MFS transporter [Bacteroidales bacterium]